MQTYEILVRNRAIVANSTDMSLVRTSAGIDQVHVLFDSDEWLGFPITISFAQGDEIVSQSLPITEVVDSSEWVAESTVTVPHEVIGMVGPIRVTLQGTDSEGNHIITAKGSPLSVEEAGDVIIGDLPANVPSVDQWNQAYADAVAASNRASSAAEELDARFQEVVSNLRSTIEGAIEELMPPAYVLPIAGSDRLGGIMVGDNLKVDDAGTLSADPGVTDEQRSIIINLSLLAQSAFNTEFDEDGYLDEVNLSVKDSALPKATADYAGIVKIDDSTIKKNGDGAIYAANSYTLPTANTTSLGGVKVDGSSIGIRADGTIFATGGWSGGYTLPVSSTVQLGGIKVDGDVFYVDGEGVLRTQLLDAEEMHF